MSHSQRSHWTPQKRQRPPVLFILSLKDPRLRVVPSFQLTTKRGSIGLLVAEGSSLLAAVCDVGANSNKSDSIQVRPRRF